MNPAARVHAALAQALTGAMGASELAHATGLDRTAVERALAELAV
jgi:DNA-binding IclR family transcriptional regulator